MKLKALFFACAMSLGQPAHAALTSNVTDIPDPQIIDFENFDGFITVGPEIVMPGASFTGTSGSVPGAFVADLGTNGLWGRATTLPQPTSSARSILPLSMV